MNNKVPFDRSGRVAPEVKCTDCGKVIVGEAVVIAQRTYCFDCASVRLYGDIGDEIKTPGSDTGCE